MSRSVRDPDYRRPQQPTARIEWTGRIQVHQPITTSGQRSLTWQQTSTATVTRT